MNLTWKKINDNHHQSGNILLVYDTKSQEGKIRAVIFLTPKMIELGNKRVLFSRVYFRTTNHISDYVFHAVSDDLFELCEGMFGKEEIYKTAFNEYNTVLKIPSIEPFTFGDYSNS